MHLATEHDAAPAWLTVPMERRGGDGHRVMLIEPPFYRLYKDGYSLTRFPLALAYLAGAALQHTGWHVRAFNADFTPACQPMRVRYLAGRGYHRYLAGLRGPSPVWDQTEAALRAYRPRVVGISAKTQNFASACRVARLAKIVDPGVIVVVGGPHPSMAAEAVLRQPDIDAAVCGEGEQTLVEFLRAVEAGGDLGQIAGLAWRDRGVIRLNPPRPLLTDLDAMPFPHQVAPRVLQDFDQYPPGALNHVFAARGCPFNCWFCGSRNIWTRRVRVRSPRNIAAELAGLQRLGVASAHFDDDTFGVNPAHIHATAAAIAHHCPGMRFTCELHAKLVHADLLAALKTAGCTGVQLGVESGSDAMLKRIRKGATIREILDAAHLIKRHGLRLEAFFIIGFPEETEATLAQTVHAMHQIPSDRLIYSVFTPYPGTESFTFCLERGLVDESFDVALYNHQSPANCFCLHIPRRRFRTLARRVETLVDRKNRRAVWRDRGRRWLHKLARAA
jgi:radical SAM superfamily enzyme YgiQ (UPF0313 family)